MAKSKTSDHAKRTLKGTTSRQQSTLRNAPLIIIPLLVLIAAAARGLPSGSHGEIPDWEPSAATAAEH